MTLTKQIESTLNAMSAWKHGNELSVKKLFHSRGRKLLTEYAKLILVLTPDQFEVRSCIGGNAILGEVTLHTDNIYVQIHAPHFGDTQNVLFRKCDGRKDYCGKTNNYISLRNLDKINLMTQLNHPFCVMA
jgi:hypothetical protein